MLKNLEASNREKWEKYKRDLAILESQKSGFECPRCRAELWRKDPHLVFGDGKTNPMTRELYCPSCVFLAIEVL